MNWEPQVTAWSLNQFFAEHLLSLESQKICGKDVIIYSVSHSEYRWEKFVPGYPVHCQLAPLGSVQEEVYSEIPIEDVIEHPPP